MTSVNSLVFRPDIEGLRAVAILLVVAAHANVSGFAGGFIGVDVFFVLSGYLITALLVKEQESFGQIRVGNFYTRRIRRLLPSLLVVLVCSILLAQQLLPPIEHSRQAITAATAAVWLSNFHFLWTDLDYFGLGHEGNIFLHTWSLSVEEQFYLFWPMLLIGLCGFGVSSQQQLNIKRLKRVLLGLFIGGFFVCLIWSSFNPMQAFYMTPARVWQFALGAIVFVYFGRNDNKVHDGKIVLSLGWFGLLAILFAAIFLDAETHYPGLWTFLPSLGAAFILASGVYFPDRGIGKWLSLPLLTGLGRVSYVWYLWHWPVLLLGAEVIDSEQPMARAGLVLLSLLLAVLTHYLVETPFRKNERLQLAVQPTLAIGLCLMIATSAFAISVGDEAQRRLFNDYSQPYEKARWDAPSIYSMECDDWYERDEVRLCEFGSNNAKKTVVMLGDSIGLQWLPTVEAVFNSSEWKILVLTKSACPMVDESVFYQRIKKVYEVCERWRKGALEKAAELKPDLLLIGSSHAYSFTEEQWRGGTQRVLQSISPHSRQVYVLQSTPSLSFNGPSCLSTRGWLYERLVRADRCTDRLYDEKRDQVHDWVSSVTQTFENVHTIDMKEEICPDGICYASRDGLFVFRDSRHLTASFAKSLSTEFAKKMKLGEWHEHTMTGEQEGM